jgi:hypothetical protein
LRKRLGVVWNALYNSRLYCMAVIWSVDYAR